MFTQTIRLRETPVLLFAETPTILRYSMVFLSPSRRIPAYFIEVWHYRLFCISSVIHNSLVKPPFEATDGILK